MGDEVDEALLVVQREVRRETGGGRAEATAGHDFYALADGVGFDIFEAVVADGNREVAEPSEFAKCVKLAEAGGDARTSYANSPSRSATVTTTPG